MSDCKFDDHGRCFTHDDQRPKMCTTAVDDRRRSLEDELARYKRLLHGLLAVMHRDGGHYTGKHGLEKSVTDAEALRARYVTLLDMAQFDIGRMLQKNLDPIHLGIVREKIQAVLG